VGHLLFALRVSCETGGVAIGRAPAFVHAIGIPINGVLALVILDRASYGWSIPFRQYLWIYPVAVIVVAGLICLAGSWGSRPHQQRMRQT